MKTSKVQLCVRALPLAAAALLLPLAQPADAAISGINAASSLLVTSFDDTSSLNPSSVPGITSSTFSVPSWSGAPAFQPTVIDPNTGDFASGGYFAFGSGSNYSVFLNSVQVSHQTGNTGFAALGVVYSVEFQCDAAGLPLAPINNFVYTVTGSVQPGGFASFTGVITYTSQALGLLDQLNYAYLNTTPGAFFANVPGTPTSGAPFALPANDKLTVSGQFRLVADPAFISVTTVPEPTSLALLAPVAALVRRRRR